MTIAPAPGNPTSETQPPVGESVGPPVSEGTAPPTIDSHGGKLSPVTHGGLDFLTVLVGGILLFSPIAALVYGLGQSDRPPSPFRTAVRTLPLFILALAVAATLAFEAGDADPHTMLLWSLLGLAFVLNGTGDALLANNRTAPGLSFQLGGRLCLGLLFALATGTALVGRPEWIGAGLILLAVAAAALWLWRGMGRNRAPLLALLVLSGLAACFALTQRTLNEVWTVAGLTLLVSDLLLAASLARDVRLFGSARLTATMIWLAYYGAHLAALFGMIGYLDRY